MHPYLHEQMMTARCDELHRQRTPSRGTVARAGHRRRPPLRRDVGWLLVHVGLRLALGPEQHGRAAHRAGAAQPG
jgi:hypothetical protein